MLETKIGICVTKSEWMQCPFSIIIILINIHSKKDCLSKYVRQSFQIKIIVQSSVCLEKL